MTITWNVTWDSSVAGQQGSLSAAPSTTAFGRIVDEVPVLVSDDGDRGDGYGRPSDDVPEVDDVKRIPRPLRPVCVVLGGWLGVFVVVNLVIVLTGVAARWAGKDPRNHGDGWPTITNLRLVDDKLLVGGETTAEDYRELAERDVTLVIDARTGGAADTSTDDPELLTELGMEYVQLPIPDGRAPTTGQIRRFLDLVESNDGRVFAHCGGGVGRATSLAAVYEAAQGQDPATMEQLATGPPTIEQIWFVATLRPDQPVHHINPAIAVTSRIVDAPRNLYGWVKSLF